MWYLSVSATPKEYTAGTVVTFTARTDTGATASAEAQNNGGVFTAENWAVPMGTSPGGEVQVSVVLTDGDAIRTQTLETLYEDPSAYRLDVDGFWDDGVAERSTSPSAPWTCRSQMAPASPWN